MEKNSDGGIFFNCNFGRALQNDKLNIQKKRALPGTNTQLSMIIVADEAFPLKTYMMRPYPGRDLTNDKTIYNYRLSRAIGYLKMLLVFFSKNFEYSREGFKENLIT
jgi:hypothetical protein